MKLRSGVKELNMKKIMMVATVIAWLFSICVIIKSLLERNVESLIPIYAYNSPQGVLGWGLTIAIVLSILYSVIPDKRSRK